MEWIEWLFSRELRQYILEHGLFIPLFFLARIVFVTGIELLAPARKIPYRSVFLYDVVGWTVLAYTLVPVSEYISGRIGLRMDVPELIFGLPAIALFLIYFLIGDFWQYWVHRALHWGPAWRTHKWHHSPTVMYWLAGYRGSFLQQICFNLPWVFAISVFSLAPWWLFLAVTVSHILQNDWMHLNVSWRLKWMEWVLVTPHYHHVHHSDNPAHLNTNFGITFTFWDRLFGTYLDPDAIKQPLTFGIGEKVPLPRLVIGV